MGVCADGHQYRLVDVAPTIAAMLRVPVPRHSAGTYIMPIFDAEATLAEGAASGGHALRTWQWKDLYQQRHAEIKGFLSHPEVAAHTRTPTLTLTLTLTPTLTLALNLPSRTRRWRPRGA